MPKYTQQQKEIYSVKISIKRMKPPIWRRVHLWSDTTLRQLHMIIQGTMRWENHHLHKFDFTGNVKFEDFMHLGGLETALAYGNAMEAQKYDEKTTRLNQVAPPGTTFAYVYDFGDNWDIVIQVEKVVGQLHVGIKLPICVAGRRASPREGGIGIRGYEYMPSEDEEDENEVARREEIDPAKFDRQEIDAALCRLQT
ncbi:hypothetical protein BGZ65_007369 [Modicella reniformis]|uniref:Plasmid pRiA4b Orf3-like domain-containing protein n=1 Tax=Modicella reniformis TaxID=1440133 RepID=A0A9P6LSD2_9FUNG|nr:hypothetical protein BGZ65_007369 [Modicella reniformis]